MKFNKNLLEEYSTKNSRPLQDYSFGSKQKVYWICNACKNEWQTRIGHRVNGSGCPKCGCIKSQKQKTKKRKSIQETHPHIAEELLDSLNTKISYGCNKKLNWLCKKCNNKYTSTPNRRCRGSGCPYCSGRLATSQNNLLKLRPDLAEELINASPSSICCFSNKILKWKCKICNKKWSSTANNRSQGKGCPSCSKKNSKPQKKIEEFFLKKNIDFKKEYKNIFCKDKRVLPFDFAVLKNSKIVGLIEYQGEQHYFPIWGKKRLKLAKKHDIIKLNYCKNNSIPFLAIPFYEKNLEDAILNFVEKINQK